VRLDLALQHQRPARGPSIRDLLDQPHRQSAEESGVIFSRFAAEMAMGAPEALLIVAERPETVWGAARLPEQPDSGVGPPAPALPTLGEAMLWAEPDGVRRARAIVVLIPRLPEQFQLAAAGGATAPTAPAAPEAP
jgi:hypothetical protein